MDDETRKQMNVEETFAALDRIIGKLEKGDGSLEDAFADYEEGMKLVKSCNEKIETIEKKILILRKGSVRRSRRLRQSYIHICRRRPDTRRRSLRQ